MTITDYASLKTTVVEYLHRTDLTDAQISNFVRFGEKQLNRKLRLQEQETETTLSLVAGANTIDLPAGFLEPIDLYYDDDKYHLQPQNINDLNESRDYDTVTSKPRLYAVSGGKLNFESIADATYSLKFTYLKKWDIAADDTNWLLDEADDLYLFSALLQAKAFVKNQSDLLVWAKAVKDTIKDLNRVSGRSRGKATVRVDRAIVRPGRFQIQRGY